MQWRSSTADPAASFSAGKRESRRDRSVAARQIGGRASDGAVVQSEKKRTKKAFWEPQVRGRPLRCPVIVQGAWHEPNPELLSKGVKDPLIPPVYLLVLFREDLCKRQAAGAKLTVFLSSCVA